MLKCALDHVTTDAQALLRAAQEIHAERHGTHTFTPGTHLPLEAAAERVGIHPGRCRHDGVVEALEYEDVINWAMSARYARGDKHYGITKAGLDGVGQD